jgi:hypoxanthine phosphoribosyltransferase
MPDAAAAWELLRTADIVCTADEVKAAIQRIAEEVAARLEKTYPLVLAVMGGGVFFAGQLLPLLRFPLDFDYIHATRYGSSTVGLDVDWRVAPPEAVRGRTVLVLDDILDGGNTMRAIRDRILEQGAEAFFSAVLTEKELARSKPIIPDFVGLSVPDRFVFGCGMDARGYWRNLPQIYALKDS